jgi:hypothetical protein
MDKDKIKEIIKSELVLWLDFSDAEEVSERLSSEIIEKGNISG